MSAKFVFVICILAVAYVTTRREQTPPYHRFVDRHILEYVLKHGDCTLSKIIRYVQAQPDTLNMFRDHVQARIGKLENTEHLELFTDVESDYTKYRITKLGQRHLETLLEQM